MYQERYHVLFVPTIHLWTDFKIGISSVSKPHMYQEIYHVLFVPTVHLWKDFKIGNQAPTPEIIVRGEYGEGRGEYGEGARTRGVWGYGKGGWEMGSEYMMIYSDRKVVVKTKVKNYVLERGRLR